MVRVKRKGVLPYADRRKKEYTSTIIWTEATFMCASRILRDNEYSFLGAISEQTRTWLTFQTLRKRGIRVL